jgi:hypothetical protein
MSVLKAKADIFTSIAGVILVIMYVEIFKYYCHCLYWRCQHVFDVTLSDTFQYQSQFLPMRVTN